MDTLQHVSFEDGPVQHIEEYDASKFQVKELRIRDLHKNFYEQLTPRVRGVFHSRSFAENGPRILSGEQDPPHEASARSPLASGEKFFEAGGEARKGKSHFISMEIPGVKHHLSKRRREGSMSSSKSYLSKSKLLDQESLTHLELGEVNVRNSKRRAAKSKLTPLPYCDTLDHGAEDEQHDGGCPSEFFNVPIQMFPNALPPQCEDLPATVGKTQFRFSYCSDGAVFDKASVDEGPFELTPASNASNMRHPNPRRPRATGNYSEPQGVEASKDTEPTERWMKARMSSRDKPVNQKTPPVKIRSSSAQTTSRIVEKSSIDLTHAPGDKKSTTSERQSTYGAQKGKIAYMRAAETVSRTTDITTADPRSPNVDKKTIIVETKSGTTLTAGRKTLNSVTFDKKCILDGKTNAPADKKSTTVDKKCTVADKKSTNVDRKSIDKKTTNAEKKSGTSLTAGRKTLNSVTFDKECILDGNKNTPADKKSTTVGKKCTVADKKSTNVDRRSSDNKTTTAEKKSVTSLIAGGKTLHSMTFDKECILNGKTNAPADKKRTTVDKKSTVDDKESKNVIRKSTAADKKSMSTHRKSATDSQKKERKKRGPVKRLRSGYTSEDDISGLDVGSQDTAYPSFAVQMIHSNVTTCYWLSIPASFAGQYLPSEDACVVLEDSKGLKWETNYLYHKKGLSGGWRRFAADQGLELGDVARFDLVRPLRLKVCIDKASMGAGGNVRAPDCHPDSYVHMVRDFRKAKAHSSVEGAGGSVRTPDCHNSSHVHMVRDIKKAKAHASTEGPQKKTIKHANARLRSPSLHTALFSGRKRPNKDDLEGKKYIKKPHLNLTPDQHHDERGEDPVPLSPAPAKRSKLSLSSADSDDDDLVYIKNMDWIKVDDNEHIENDCKASKSSKQSEDKELKSRTTGPVSKSFLLYCSEMTDRDHGETSRKEAVSMKEKARELIHGASPELENTKNLCSHIHEIMPMAVNTPLKYRLEQQDIEKVGTGRSIPSQKKARHDSGMENTSADHVYGEDCTGEHVQILREFPDDSNIEANVCRSPVVKWKSYSDLLMGEDLPIKGVAGNLGRDVSSAKNDNVKSPSAVYKWDSVDEVVHKYTFSGDNGSGAASQEDMTVESSTPASQKILKQKVNNALPVLVNAENEQSEPRKVRTKTQFHQSEVRKSKSASNDDSDVQKESEDLPSYRMSKQMRGKISSELLKVKEKRVQNDQCGFESKTPLYHQPNMPCIKVASNDSAGNKCFSKRQKGVGANHLEQVTSRQKVKALTKKSRRRTKVVDEQGVGEEGGVVVKPFNGLNTKMGLSKILMKQMREVNEWEDSSGVLSHGTQHHSKVKCEFSIQFSAKPDTSSVKQKVKKAETVRARDGCRLDFHHPKIEQRGENSANATFGPDYSYSSDGNCTISTADGDAKYDDYTPNTPLPLRARSASAPLSVKISPGRSNL